MGGVPNSWKHSNQEIVPSTDIRNFFDFFVFPPEALT